MFTVTTRKMDGHYLGAYASGLDRHSYKVKAGGSNPPVPTRDTEKLVPKKRQCTGLGGSTNGCSGVIAGSHIQ